MPSASLALDISSFSCYAFLKEPQGGERLTVLEPRSLKLLRYVSSDDGAQPGWWVLLYKIQVLDHDYLSASPPSHI
jgi:hypothetical protein